MKELRLLILVFVFFSLCDLKVTEYFLNNTEIKELNPVANYVFQQWGTIGLIALKGISITLLVTLIPIINKHKPTMARNLLLFFSGLSAIIVSYSIASIIEIYYMS